MVVPVQTSLSLTSRWLTRVIAVTYLLLGLTMFVLPGWSAHHFPWKVSPFVAMTIGSYLLGSAWVAGIIQHTWTFARVYTLLLYLWLFGVLETVAVVIHRDKLAAGAVLTIPYLATYVVVMIGTVVILWWDRRATSRVARPAGLPASAPSWCALAAPAAWR
jgi:hypothetical protein